LRSIMSKHSVAAVDMWETAVCARPTICDHPPPVLWLSATQPAGLAASSIAPRGGASGDGFKWIVGLSGSFFVWLGFNYSEMPFDFVPCA